jgi:magnesium-transporting ATPase (P-type)
LGKAIFGFGGFVWVLCVAILWGMNHTAVIEGWGATQLATFFAALNPTIFFATYMTINWWNMFNARVIGKNKSIFDGLFDNAKFLGIMAFILGVTILIVQIGGEVFQTIPLSAATWGWIILLTSPIAWVREIYFQLTKKR